MHIRDYITIRKWKMYTTFNVEQNNWECNSLIIVNPDFLGYLYLIIHFYYFYNFLKIIININSFR